MLYSLNYVLLAGSSYDSSTQYLFVIWFCFSQAFAISNLRISFSFTKVCTNVLACKLFGPLAERGPLVSDDSSYSLPKTECPDIP